MERRPGPQGPRLRFDRLLVSRVRCRAAGAPHGGTVALRAGCVKEGGGPRRRAPRGLACLGHRSPPGTREALPRGTGPGYGDDAMDRRGAFGPLLAAPRRAIVHGLAGFPRLRHRRPASCPPSRGSRLARRGPGRSRGRDRGPGDRGQPGRGGGSGASRGAPHAPGRHRADLPGRLAPAIAPRTRARAGSAEEGAPVVPRGGAARRGGRSRPARAPPARPRRFRRQGCRSTSGGIRVGRAGEPGRHSPRGRSGGAGAAGCRRRVDGGARRETGAVSPEGSQVR